MNVFDKCGSVMKLSELAKQPKKVMDTDVVLEVAQGLVNFFWPTKSLYTYR